jgi:molecular chaperone GrpE
MEDDENTSTAEHRAETSKDPRFEVKWRKKESAPRPAASEPPEEVLEGHPPADNTGIQAELDAERERTRELQDKWQRSAADLANLRRRHEQEREDLEKMASMALVYDLLPVLDNFERAIATLPGNLRQLTWIHGILLVERQMRAILESRGVTAIEAEGKTFDPKLHEAVSERETDDSPPNTVVSVYQSGYTMHGYLIRPALVEVSKAPAKHEQKPETASLEVADSAEGEPVEEAEEQNVGP